LRVSNRQEWRLTFSAVRCPPWRSAQRGNRGRPRCGPPRSLGQHLVGVRGRGLLAYRPRGGRPAGPPQSLARSRNTRGRREPARGRQSSTATGLRERWQPDTALESVTPARRHTRPPDDGHGAMARAGAAERAARGRVGGHRPEPRWRWPAITPAPGAVGAYDCGRRQAEGVRQGQARLEPLGLPRFETAHGGAYPRPLAPAGHGPGRRHPQPSERQPRPSRRRLKRLVRMPIGWSQATQRPERGMGLCVNRYAGGRAA